MRVTILGSGTSFGVPSVACDCPVCTSPDPRNRRDRASIYVETDGVALLVDTATEFRLHALRFTPHPTHFTLPESLAVVADLRPRRTLLTHISHEMDHAAVAASLPPGVELAYDGLVAEV